VSLGVFSKRANADAHVTALTAKGFEVEVLPVASRSKSVWLDIGSVPAGAAADALSVRIAEVAPGTRTVAVACDRLVAADGLE
jgi:hypothetical protein